LSGEQIDGLRFDSSGGTMVRIWKTPVLVLATAYFVLDGLFSYVTRPVVVWMSKLRMLERTRRWIVSLRPYPSLALFAVPVIILEPAKPLAGYLAATGHFLAGAITFVTAEVVKLSFVERLFLRFFLTPMENPPEMKCVCAGSHGAVVTKRGDRLLFFLRGSYSPRVPVP